MHVHTSYGSSDSNLSLDELHNKSKILNIDAVCLTEHGGPWSLQSITQAQQKMDNLKLLNAMEIETEVGHITAFGFTQYISGMRNPESLRQIADKEGAFIVLAHPFRNFTQKPPYNNNNLLFKDYKIKPETIEDVAKHPIFELVDAILVLFYWYSIAMLLLFFCDSVIIVLLLYCYYGAILIIFYYSFLIFGINICNESF